VEIVMKTREPFVAPALGPRSCLDGRACEGTAGHAQIIGGLAVQIGGEDEITVAGGIFCERAMDLDHRPADLMAHPPFVD